MLGCGISATRHSYNAFGFTMHKFRFAASWRDLFESTSELDSWSLKARAGK
jgi:hypothetical protein